MNDDEPEDYNKVTITLTFQPDKWWGKAEWQAKVEHLLKTAELLDMHEGRASMDFVKEVVDAYEEREDWGDGRS